MKVAGKKIPKGTVLLLLSFTAISLCLLLIVSAARAERINDMSRNNMYTGHQKNFSVYNAEEKNVWEDVIENLSAKYDDFAIYMPMQDPEIVVRGVCVKGSVEEPPMIEGEYFDFDSSWSEMPTIVLGKDCQENIIEWNGKKYCSYGGIQFEVLGVMGTKEDSRINHMMLFDLRSAVRMAGVNTSYVLDTKKEPDVAKIGEELGTLFRLPAEVMILLDKGDGMSPIAQLLSSGRIMETMHVMILISFSLSSILVTFIWLRFRRTLLLAWQLCGYKEYMKGLETAKRYYLAAGFGFVAGLLLMALFSLMVEDMQVKIMDIVQAFGMTVGLGTVILFSCYMIDRRKT